MSFQVFCKDIKKSRKVIKSLSHPITPSPYHLITLSPHHPIPSTPQPSDDEAGEGEAKDGGDVHQRTVDLRLA